MFSLLNFTPTFSQSDDEDILIGAYIERFTRFIEYPVSNKNEDFKLYITGNSDLLSTFQQVFSTQKILGKNVKVYFSNNLNDLKNANLIYISGKESSNLGELIDLANSKSILLVSYAKGFAERGIHINIYKQNRMLRFEININSIKKAGFSVSHLLLSKAKVIE